MEILCPLINKRVPVRELSGGLKNWNRNIIDLDFRLAHGTKDNVAAATKLFGCQEKGCIDHCSMGVIGADQNNNVLAIE
jgi:hypothetical protein